MLTKTDARKQVRTLLAPHGFHADGNYVRRDVGSVRQALYLQASRWGGIYYPEMMATFADLAPGRRNTQADAHLRARVSSYYHPDGDPRLVPRQAWLVRYDIDDEQAAVQAAQWNQALPCVLAWMESWPSWQRAAELMLQRQHATWVTRHLLFEDLGQAVPTPA